MYVSDCIYKLYFTGNFGHTGDKLPFCYWVRFLPHQPEFDAQRLLRDDNDQEGDNHSRGLYDNYMMMMMSTEDDDEDSGELNRTAQYVEYLKKYLRLN